MLKCSIMVFTYPTGLRTSRIAVLKILGFKGSLYTLKNYCGPPEVFMLSFNSHYCIEMDTEKRLPL